MNGLAALFGIIEELPSFKTDLWWDLATMDENVLPELLRKVIKLTASITT